MKGLVRGHTASCDEAGLEPWSTCLWGLALHRKGVCSASHPVLPPVGSLSVPWALPGGTPSAPLSPPSLSSAPTSPLCIIPKTHLSCKRSRCCFGHFTCAGSFAFPGHHVHLYYCHPHLTDEETEIWKGSGVAVLQPMGGIWLRRTHSVRPGNVICT